MSGSRASSAPSRVTRVAAEKAGSRSRRPRPMRRTLHEPVSTDRFQQNFKGRLRHPRWHAPTRATGGVEGLRRYYEGCLTGSGPRMKTTLERDRRKTLESERERFMSIYRGAP